MKFQLSLTLVSGSVNINDETSHTANGGHVTKFQGGDTNGSGCVGATGKSTITEQSEIALFLG